MARIGCVGVYVLTFSAAQKAGRNLMHRHFATFRRRINKDRCLPVNAKFVSGVMLLFNRQPKLDNVISVVSLHVNMTPLTAQNRLLIKTLRTK